MLIVAFRLLQTIIEEQKQKPDCKTFISVYYIQASYYCMFFSIWIYITCVCLYTLRFVFYLETIVDFLLTKTIALRISEVHLETDY